VIPLVRRRKVIRLPGGKTIVAFADDVETASVRPVKNAALPKPEPKYLGDGWYELPDGRKARKNDPEAGD